MDLLSVTSSIAGILSIAGQSIDGIVKLKQLFSDISAASKTIGTFLRDINSLLHVLHDVEALLFQLDIRTYSGAIDISTASLQIELEDCLKDVFAWLRTARSLRPPSDLGTRAWLQKVWVAINQNSVKGIREDIGRHKQALQVNLALIGRSLDLRSSSSMALLHERMQHLQSITTSISSASTEQRRILRRLNSISDFNSTSLHRGTSDLISMCSSTPELELFHDSGSSGYQLSKRLVNPSSPAPALRSQSDPELVKLAYTKINSEDCSICLPRPRTLNVEQDHLLAKTRRDNSPDLMLDTSSLICTVPSHGSASLAIHSQPWSSDTLVDDHNNTSRIPQISCNHSRRRRSSSYLHPIPEVGTCLYSSSSDNILSSRCDQSLWQGPSLTEIRRNNPDVDKIKKSRSKGSPCGTENSGIWISGSWNARDDAHEHPSRSSRSHYFEDDYKALDNTTAQFFPKSVARYISHRQMVVMLTSQIRLLPVHSDLNPQHKSSELAMEFQQTLKARLAILMDEMKVLRNTCLQASYALYEIDQVLAVAQEEDIGASQNSHRAAHQDMLELRRSTLESNLLQTWTNSRDRINGWLLHSLRADDKLAQLHRAILGEQDIGEKAWARLVLKYWTLDEAATGKPLSRAQSAAATNSVHSVSTQSLDFWTCNESAGDHDELLTGVRLGQVRTELEALKRQHHRRLYKAFVNSASSEADESDNGVGLEMR